VGFCIGARRITRTGFPSRAWIVGSAIVSALWLCGIVLAASSNALGPAAVPVAVVTTLIAGFGLLAIPGYRTVIGAIPPHWLIAIQVFRIVGGTFLIRYGQNSLPGAFAIPAGTGDLVTGILAPFVAYGLASGKSWGRGAAIAWNIFGIADLVDALALGITFLGSGLTFPTILIPIYGVPRAIILHGYSLIGLLRGSRQNQPAWPSVRPAE
jgi:hypothetical protein